MSEGQRWTPPPNCWGTIGVHGDRSCPELAAAVHCRNCAVLRRGAADLLRRPAPAAYAQGWADLVAAPLVEEEQATSVVVFRLGAEWLAIETGLVAEVAEPRTVRRVAHRVHTLLAGLVNIRGQIHLCVALDQLLQMPATDPADVARLVVLSWLEETWVFPASEVHGVVRFPTSSLGAPPATLPPALAALTRGIFPSDGAQVAFLHSAQLIAALKRAIA